MPEAARHRLEGGSMRQASAICAGADSGGADRFTAFRRPRLSAVRDEAKRETRRVIAQA